MSSIQRFGVTRRWSDIVVHGSTAYFVEVPDDPSVDAHSQIKQVLEQIDRRLASVGSDKTKLLQVTIYLPQPTDLPILNELWDAWLPEGHAPSRACLHAQLVSPEYRIEMILVAAVSNSPRESGR